MVIWPMPKKYTRCDEEVVVDRYSFHFVPNKDHKDILAAIDRYSKLFFGDNIAAPARGKALAEVTIDIKDYDAPLNVLHVVVASL